MALTYDLADSTERKITAAQMREFLAKGRTGRLQGFTSRDGREFEATLAPAAEGKVGFDFGR